jgi:membrane protein implicated in regulation of membrane protease activity
MDWQYWLILGIGFLVAEVAFAGSFFLFFFGLGAFIVGALCGIGLVGEPWLEWVLFAGISVGLLLVFRQQVKSLFGRGGGADVDSVVGARGRTNESLAPGASGRGTLRGSEWTVRNVGGASLAAGQEFVVRGVDGLTLDVAGVKG